MSLASARRAVLQCPDILAGIDMPLLIGIIAVLALITFMGLALTRRRAHAGGAARRGRDGDIVIMAPVVTSSVDCSSSAGGSCH